MRILEVIEMALVGIFSDPELSRQLVLKGGTAMHLFEKMDERLSTDVDFSSREGLAEAAIFFDRMKQVLTAAYEPSGLDLFDFQYQRRPKESKKRPQWWGGWACKFKLSPHSDRHLKPEQRRRQALIPEGTPSSIIDIEISDREYVGKPRHKTLHGVKINGYTLALLVVEKLRAICQQHPDYPHRGQKNRARDLVDIFHLTRDHQTVAFLEECKRELPKSFEVKEVDVGLLRGLHEDDFVEMLRAGFPQVRDTLQGSVYPFETYLEYIRDFVSKIT